MCSTKHVIRCLPQELFLNSVLKIKTNCVISHTRTVLSSLPLTIVVSFNFATDQTFLVCPLKTATHKFLAQSHTRTVLSILPLTIVVSFKFATERTSLVCPFKIATHKFLTQSHTRMVLSILVTRTKVKKKILC